MTRRIPLTPWEEHKQRWSKGCGHTMCSKARKVVLARGTVPCDVLVVGEGPGTSEDRSGLAFVGPAWHVLNEILKRSVPSELILAFTNMVGCMPRNPDGKPEPTEEQIDCCKLRLEEFIRDVAQPRGILCVGRIPGDFLQQGYKWSVKVDRSIHQCVIRHPSAILRMDETRQQQAAQETIHVILDWIDDHFS